MSFDTFLILLALPATTPELRKKLGRGDSMSEVLRNLEQNGMVERAGGPVAGAHKNPYRWELTSAGKQTVIRNLAAIRRLTKDNSQ